MIVTKGKDFRLVNGLGLTSSINGYDTGKQRQKRNVVIEAVPLTTPLSTAISSKIDENIIILILYNMTRELAAKA